MRCCHIQCNYFKKPIISSPVPSKICSTTPPSHESVYNDTEEKTDETQETACSRNQLNPTQYYSYKVQFPSVSIYKSKDIVECNNQKKTRNLNLFNHKALSSIPSPKKHSVSINRKSSETIEAPIFQRVMDKLIKRYAILDGNALKIMKNSQNKRPLTIIYLCALYNLEIGENTVKIFTTNKDCLIEFSSTDSNFINSLKNRFINEMVSQNPSNKVIENSNNLAIDDLLKTCDSGDLLLYQNKNFSAKLQRIVTRSAYGSNISRSCRLYL